MLHEFLFVKQTKKKFHAQCNYMFYLYGINGLFDIFRVHLNSLLVIQTDTNLIFHVKFGISMFFLRAPIENGKY